MLDNADPLMGAAWHVVAASEEVGAEPTVLWLLGRRWSLSRHGAGSSSAELTAVDDNGANPHGVLERYGLIWLAPEVPLSPLPVLAEPADPRFATAIITRQTKVSAGVLTDNFLDVSHFSYLHPVTFGRLEPVTDENCVVSRRDWEVELRHSTDLHEGADGQPTAATQPSPSWRIATYTVVAPFVTHLSLHFPADDSLSAATLICQPETDDRTTARVLVCWPADDPEGLARQIELSVAVLEEDLSILELMADPRLALSLREELHTRADRASVEYRRLISDHLRCAAERSQV